MHIRPTLLPSLLESTVPVFSVVRSTQNGTLYYSQSLPPTATTARPRSRGSCRPTRSLEWCRHALGGRYEWWVVWLPLVTVKENCWGLFWLPFPFEGDRSCDLWTDAHTRTVRIWTLKVNTLCSRQMFLPTGLLKQLRWLGWITGKVQCMSVQCTMYNMYVYSRRVLYNPTT